MFALEIKTWYTARDISTEFPSNQEYKSLILSVKFDIDSVSQNTITHLLFAHGPRREKTCLRGFRQSEIQASLLSYRD